VPNKVNREGETGVTVTILGLAGSPRARGNTEILLDRALEGAASQGANIEKVVISRLDISPCRGCERCFETGRCVVQDGYQALYERLISAERIILASPIYFTGLTAQTKTLIDRCQCLWARRYILRVPLPATPSGQPRLGAFISTAGDKRTSFDCAMTTARAFFAVLHTRYELLANGVDERGAVNARQDLLDQAYALGARLVQASENPK
jgi:multimeric flavodoxin WrbA